MSERKTLKSCDMCKHTMTGRVFSYRNAPKNGFCSGCYKKLPMVQCTECQEECRTVEREGFVCFSCKLKKRTCSECGVIAPTHARVLKGKVFCNNCAYRVLETRPCTICKKAFKGEANWPEGKPVCPACKKKLKKAKACAHCGNLSLFVESDAKAGIHEKICIKCRTYGHVTCAGCHKHRKPAALDKKGRQICKECHARGTRPFMCPQCGCAGIKHSKTRCERCYWRDYAIQRVLRCQTLLSHQWAKDLFADFIQYLYESKEPGFIATRVERYFPFFAKVDALFSSKRDVCSKIMLQEFGADGLRRFSAPYDYLARQKVIIPLTASEITTSQELRAHHQLLEKVDGHWYEKEVKELYEHLQSLSTRYKKRGWKDKAKYKPRTITAALRATILFYQYVDQQGVTSTRQLYQAVIDGFIAEHPGYKNSLRSLIRFIKKKKRVFRKVKIEHVPSTIAENSFLPRSKYFQLLSTWLLADGEDTKKALIGIFMLLYAQTGVAVVRLRLVDFFLGRNGNYKVAFGRSEIELDARVSELLSRYLEVRAEYLRIRDDANNEWLFPGRRFNAHLTPAVVTGMLAEYGISAHQMFATSIYNAYQTGMTQPKILVNAFGITSHTAIKYLKLVDPRIFDEALTIHQEQYG